MAGAAGHLQAYAVEAAAAADQLVVAGIAQQRGVRLAVERLQIGAHAAEAAGVLVGVEQQVDAAAAHRTVAHQVGQHMRQDRRAGLGIGRPAAPQPTVVDSARGGRLRPSRLVAEWSGVDAGIEAEDRARLGGEVTHIEAGHLAGAIGEVARLKPVG